MYWQPEFNLLLFENTNLAGAEKVMMYN